MKDKLIMTKKLNEDEMMSLTRDSKIVAIRWDLVEWGLVFDLDVPISEAKNSPVYRAWLVFKGVSMINIPLNNSRLPNGCFLTSSIISERVVDGFEDYHFNAMLPCFDEYDKCVLPVTKLITIRAKELCGVSSINSTNTDDYGFIERKTRLSLATDDEMLIGL